MHDDKRTDEATQIDPDDSPAGKRLDGIESYKQYYQRLSNANDPEWNGPWRDENVTTRSDHQYLLGAVASSLSLTDHQRERAGKIIDSLPPRHFRGNRNVVVVLSVCGHVGRKDNRAYHPVHLARDADKCVDESMRDFVEFAEREDISQGELAGCWERIGDEL